MEYSWFRMHHEIIDDEKVGQLAFEDRWHFVALLCLKCRGMLDKYVGAKLDNHVGFKLGLGDVDRDRLRIRLAEAGLITSEWQPVGWDGRQYVKSDHNGAERMRQSRARNGATLPLRHCDVTVTQPSVSVSEKQESLPEPEEDSSSSSSFLEDIKREYPRGIHNSLRMTTVHEIYSLNNIGQRKTVLEGVKRYAASVRAQGNEGTKYVMSINTFFTNELWKAEWPLPEKAKEGETESDDEKARRARARELLDKMDKGELNEF